MSRKGGSPTLTEADHRKTLAFLEMAKGNKAEASRIAKINYSTFKRQAYEAELWLERLKNPPPPPVDNYVPPDVPPPEPTPSDRIRDRLRKGDCSVSDLMAITGLGERATIGAIEDLKEAGFNVHRFGERWTLEKNPAPRQVGDATRFEIRSDAKNEFCFGFVTDNHLGSKYARLDVLNDLYDRFAKRGITQVFNAGNYIDGECRFNKFDLEDAAHGMDAQLRFLAKHYPHRKGITTRFIAGDDHEGWYGQNQGVEIGLYSERIARAEGRDDFIYLGYMEADVGLVNSESGKTAIMRVVHPGGGSAYAISYTMQKLVESYDGGDKPAVLLAGHYHKMEILNYRNVWIIQGGTTKDQDPFMRKKKIEAHVGGLIVTLEQDPATGAIIRCNDMYRYFNRAYYDLDPDRGERFSYSAPVVHRPRTLGGV